MTSVAGKKNKTKTVVSVDQNEKIDNKTPEAIHLPEKTVKKIKTKKGRIRVYRT